MFEFKYERNIAHIKAHALFENTLKFEICKRNFHDLRESCESTQTMGDEFE
jgi:hypothetical protein